MSYPQLTDYQDAVQTPARVFADPELRTGTVATGPMGLPFPRSGGFALTYDVSSHQRRFAVRCFHKEAPLIQQKYSAISTTLRSLRHPYFVNFDFQPQGIRVGGSHYPVVKMDWAEGDTLGVYLDKNSHNSEALEQLRQNFADLAMYLERNGVAHGDLQNANVIVSSEGLRLIDYDGMFVPGMTIGYGSEVGHKHFQHPERDVEHFGPHMDRFSFIVLDVSLAAMSAQPDLHKCFREGGEAIIFKANDFADPTTSDVFRLLEATPSTRDAVRKLARVCSGSWADVPKLADFRAGKYGPSVLDAGNTAQAALRARQRHYISASKVVDATNFDAAMSEQGNRIELVGQISRVLANRQDRNGQPYALIIFNSWQDNRDVRLMVWSKSLERLSIHFDKYWEYRWVSVTGMMEAPHESKSNRGGDTYISVGIALNDGSQVNAITEEEARYRLGELTLSSNQSSHNADMSPNRKLLDKLKENTPTRSKVPGTAVPKKRSAKSAATRSSPNQEIVQKLKTGANYQTPTSQSFTQSTSYSNINSQPKISNLKPLQTFFKMLDNIFTKK